MSTTINAGWLTDKNGDKFAPKTLTSQVQTHDGKLLDDLLGSISLGVHTDGLMYVFVGGEPVGNGSEIGS